MTRNFIAFAKIRPIDDIRIKPEIKLEKPYPLEEA